MRLQDIRRLIASRPQPSSLASLSETGEGLVIGWVNLTRGARVFLEIVEDEDQRLVAKGVSERGAEAYILSRTPPDGRV